MPDGRNGETNGPATSPPVIPCVGKWTTHPGRANLRVSRRCVVPTKNRSRGQDCPGSTRNQFACERGHIRHAQFAPAPTLSAQATGNVGNTSREGEPPCEPPLRYANQKPFPGPEMSWIQAQPRSTWTRASEQPRHAPLPQSRGAHRPRRSAGEIWVRGSLPGVGTCRANPRL